MGLAAPAGARSVLCWQLVLRLLPGARPIGSRVHTAFGLCSLTPDPLAAQTVRGPVPRHPCVGMGVL